MTRQWREATGKYSIAFPAGKYEATNRNVVAAGLRELTEETPFTTDLENLFFMNEISYSLDGCLGEMNQLLEVNARIKPGTRLRDGRAYGATEQTENESIQTFYCAEGGLYSFLQKMVMEGCSIDSRLMLYATGGRLIVGAA